MKYNSGKRLRQCMGLFKRATLYCLHAEFYKAKILTKAAIDILGFNPVLDYPGKL